MTHQETTLTEYLRTNGQDRFAYVGTIWGETEDGASDATGLEWANTLDALRADAPMIDHPAYGGDGGYYLQSGNVHYRDGSLLDETVLEVQS